MEGTLGEIKLFAGNFAPRGWAFCHGQTMSVEQNQALFSLLGTIYDGDGRTTFGLPDLRGRVPVGVGDAPGLQSVSLGAKGGVETMKSAQTTISTHTHSDETGTVAQSQPAAVGRQEYDNRPPSLGLNYIICIAGMYPSRD